MKSFLLFILILSFSPLYSQNNVICEDNVYNCYDVLDISKEENCYSFILKTYIKIIQLK